MLHRKNLMRKRGAIFPERHGGIEKEFLVFAVPASDRLGTGVRKGSRAAATLKVLFLNDRSETPFTEEKMIRFGRIGIGTVGGKEPQTTHKGGQNRSTTRRVAENRREKGEEKLFTGKPSPKVSASEKERKKRGKRSEGLFPLENG